MSEKAPIQASARPEPAVPDWHIRAAHHDDVAAIAAAVAELLVELHATPPCAPAMEAAARTLIEDRKTGAVLVAETDGALEGVLVASWQTAIHIPGRYALIQDLWVHPTRRSRKVGRCLLEALVAVAREQQIACIEVGLPRAHFDGLADTESFYRTNKFMPLGPRMRRMLW